MDQIYLEDIADYFNLLTKNYEFADIRIASNYYLMIQLKDGKIIRTIKSDSCGFNIRIYREGYWYMGSSNKLSKSEIKSTLKSIDKIRIKIKSSKLKLNPEINQNNILPNWKRDPRDVQISEKLDLIKSVNNSAMIKGIENREIIYSEGIDHWVIANNHGTFVSFYNSYPIIYLSVSVKDANGRQKITQSIGGNAGLEIFKDNELIKFSRETAEKAVHMINAKPVKGGRYDVVLDSAMTGVYTHEAFGHATEADGIINKSSILADKINKRVGREIITIIDDPTIPNARGSFKFDQEGVKAKRRVLVRDGILNEYLNSIETSTKIKMKQNGAARAMDISSLPIPRMSNTFIMPSKESVDIYEGIKEGVAFFDFQYGYTNPGSGNFMFKSQYGRMIRNGKLAEYVRDAALAGNTLDILNRVDAVGNDFKLHNGTCGKEGQWVPVTSGGPSIRIKGVVVGGQ